MDLARIEELLNLEPPSDVRYREILRRARRAEGLDPEDAAMLLLGASDSRRDAALFSAAREVKRALYGKRIVLFAPLYISNLCSNKCLYCAFRRDNDSLERRKLGLEEIRGETRALISMGHKRVLLEAGEDLAAAPMDYVLDAIEAIYDTHVGRNGIRRINVNVAATSVDNYERLRAAGIGTYQLFQETYHRPTYEAVHIEGPKSDYDYHLGAMDRAVTAGIDDYGIGVLFGLYDYRYETLALLAHAEYMRETHGIGPHTISVPRLQSAPGTEFEAPHPLSDDELKKVVAVLRLAAPYTGLILSTRESAQMRDELVNLGISQMSAASMTEIGGYGKGEKHSGQFDTHDHRSLDECVRDIVSREGIPSFCTGCYRKHRTGSRFMEMVEAGEIRDLCLPNAILTLAEYVEDYGSDDTRRAFERRVPEWLGEIPDERVRAATTSALAEIESGVRDVYL